jgi:hypothetical protein
MEIAVLERGEPGDDRVANFVSLDTELADGGVDVPGRPQRNGIRHQA